MNPINYLKEVVRKLKNTRYDIQRISKLVNHQRLSVTYFPDEERKSKLSIWRDNLYWLAKYKEVNRYYYVYGLDKKNAAEEEVMPYRGFRILRDSTNLHPEGEAYNYVCLLRDKFVFAQFLKSLGFPTPRNIALFNKEEITWLDTMGSAPLEALTNDAEGDIDGFAKKLTGIMGTGAFALQVKNAKLYSKGKELTFDELREKTDGQYLFQEKIVQHQQLASLHPSSVNTIRLITFNNDGKVTPLSAALRIGAKGNSVDNWASGGIVINIDLESGKLTGPGLFKPGYGVKVFRHPDSDIILEGFEIPFFKEGIAMACKLHTYLYGIHSIGWDIAITPGGPTFIEGNDDWEGGIPMALDRSFKSKFLTMYPKKNVIASPI